jgi:2-aminoadipate transaminase
LAAWAEAHDVLLLEDNAYGELRYEGEALPHLLHVGACSAATPDDRAVVHVGTFSKVIAPGLRVGWVIGPAPLIDKLTQAKQAADLHTGTLNQLLVLDLLQKGFLDQHLPVLRNAYRTRRDTMLAALARHFTGTMTWTKPAGGLFLMATLPPDCRAKDLLPEALARQVAFVPGDEFHVDGAGANTFRLNFSNATPEQIEEGILRLQQSAKGQRAKRKGAKLKAQSSK